MTQEVILIAIILLAAAYLFRRFFLVKKKGCKSCVVNEMNKPLIDQVSVFEKQD